MYIFRWRKEGGGLMHAYVLAHIFRLYYWIAWWMFMTLGKDEVLKVPHIYFGISARSTQGWIQDGAKICHGGPLLKKTSSSDPKATVTNQMHSNDLKACGNKCWCSWLHVEVKFLTRFWSLFGLSHFGCLLMKFP